MHQERSVLVPMRDGTNLSVDIFRPDDHSPSPALVALSPYGKEIQTLGLPSQPPTSPAYAREIEAGDPVFLTDRGYAHIIGDVRGTGGSEGEYRGWMSGDEARDGHDLIEWVASQPWCNGQIGMVGVSYYGAIQLAVAATQPPHLKAIMPFNAPADFYRESTHHGGMLHVFFNLIYKVKAVGRNVSVLVEKLNEGDLASLLAELAQDQDLQMYPEIYNTAIDPKRAPNFFDILAQPFDGPFYWERSPYTQYGRIKVPAYCGSGWWAFAHMHLRGAFSNFTGIEAPTKLFIESRLEAAAPMPQEYNAEVVRWYDHWLKGMDNGIMSEPPVRIHVRGAGFRDESEWPPARIEWTKLYLQRWGQLGLTPEPVDGHSDHFVQQPIIETGAVASLDYETPPLLEKLELIGPAALYLFASIDDEDTNWIVSVADVAPAGEAVAVTRGFLKASHRALDATRSRPWAPYHPHDRAEPVIPHEIYEFAIDLSPLASVFAPGHRLRVSIAAADHAHHPPVDLELGAGHTPWHISRHATVVHRVFHAPTMPSHVVLPVVSSRLAW